METQALRVFGKAEVMGRGRCEFDRRAVGCGF